MADITGGGNPVDDRSRKLRARKLDLRRMQLQTSIISAEIEMDETRDRLDRQGESLAGLRKELEVKEQEIAELEGASNG